MKKFLGCIFPLPAKQALYSLEDVGDITFFSIAMITFLSIGGVRLGAGSFLAIACTAISTAYFSKSIAHFSLSTPTGALSLYPLGFAAFSALVFTLVQIGLPLSVSQTLSLVIAYFLALSCQLDGANQRKTKLKSCRGRKQLLLGVIYYSLVTVIALSLSFPQLTEARNIGFLNSIRVWSDVDTLSHISMLFSLREHLDGISYGYYGSSYAPGYPAPTYHFGGFILPSLLGYWTPITSSAQIYLSSLMPISLTLFALSVFDKPRRLSDLGPPLTTIAIILVAYSAWIRCEFSEFFNPLVMLNNSNTTILGSALGVSIMKLAFRVPHRSLLKRNINGHGAHHGSLSGFKYIVTMLISLALLGFSKAQYLWPVSLSIMFFVLLSLGNSLILDFRARVSNRNQLYKQRIYLKRSNLGWHSVAVAATTLTVVLIGVSSAHGWGPFSDITGNGKVFHSVNYHSMLVDAFHLRNFFDRNYQSIGILSDFPDYSKPVTYISYLLPTLTLGPLYLVPVLMLATLYMWLLLGASTQKQFQIRRYLRTYIFIILSICGGFLYSVQNPLMPAVNEFRDRISVLGWSVGIFIIVSMIYDLAEIPKPDNVYRRMIKASPSCLKYLTVIMLGVIAIFVQIISAYHLRVGKKYLSEVIMGRQFDWFSQEYPTYMSNTAMLIAKKLQFLQMQGFSIALFCVTEPASSSKCVEYQYDGTNPDTGSLKKYTLEYQRSSDIPFINDRVQMLTQIPAMGRKPYQDWPDEGISKMIIKRLSGGPKYNSLAETLEGTGYTRSCIIIDGLKVIYWNKKFK